MVLSMGAVFVAVAVILVIAWRPAKDFIAPVDYNGAIDSAVVNSNWPIYIPKVIPENFEVTSARFERESYGDSRDTRWYLGFASADEFISLWQSDGDFAQIKSATIPNAQCTESKVIAEQSWQQCTSLASATNGYVRTDGELIYLVSGTVDWAELETFIASLEIAK